jgi:hypothetical protein
MMKMLNVSGKSVVEIIVQSPEPCDIETLSSFYNYLPILILVTKPQLGNHRLKTLSQHSQAGAWERVLSL